MFTIESIIFHKLEQYIESVPAAEWLDTEFFESGNKTAMFFGPKFLSDKLYQCSSAEVNCMLYYYKLN